MKKTLLFASTLAIAGLSASAQMLTGGYIQWPQSEQLHSYIQQWNGGTGEIQVLGQQWDDHNFFISRVKPKARFYNTATQVRPTLTQYDAQNNVNGNDKRLVYWVPISDQFRGGQQLNALPDGQFDGEAFTMWAYVDHYGDWNAPYGWTPGVFADVAHKNGVAVSGVASVPFGSISTAWSSELNSMVTLTAEQVGKFLYYHGQNGLGYNSEWSGWSPKNKGLTTLHEGLASYMATRDPLWEIMWYAGTTDAGSIAFDTGVGSTGGNTELFKSASMFLNYGWASTSRITSSVQHAKSNGRSPFFIYAGINQQGGEGGSLNVLKEYQYSIGLWAGHEQNILWKNRFTKGSSNEAKMRCYFSNNEMWFSNGVRNPAVKLDVGYMRNLFPTKTFGGMSALMSARSTLNWDLKAEPFYTFFNVGNGMFFNWKGERMNNNQWYNIGIQDYLPTWHYWFAPTFLQQDVVAGTTSLNADVTWADAYVGGSCLKIEGTAAEEYLHLFKTEFAMGSGTKIRVTYKLLGGEGDIDLVIGHYTDANKTAVSAKITKKILALADCENAEDKSYLPGAEGWITKEFSLGSTEARSLRPALLAFKFTNVKNMELLLGGLEIEASGASFATPATPVIDQAKTKVLAYNASGADLKLIWNMNNTKNPGEPVYNSDVNTSMFRMWSQQEGEEPVMVGMTTSWAGILFRCPVNSDSPARMRVGVSALSMDTKTESDIAWTDYKDLGEYATSDAVELSKNIIKPNESFDVRFTDPMHVDGAWTISDPDTGEVLWTGNGHDVTCPGLANIGGYTLSVSFNGTTLEFPCYISISPETVGALPVIHTMTVDGVPVDETSDDITIDVNTEKTFAYTGRAADGKASRGIDLNEKWFGVKVSELGIGANKSFSVAAWVRYDELPEGRSNFVTIEDRQNGGWPMNNWGYFWSRINDEGKFEYDGVDTAWGFRSSTSAQGMRIFYKWDDGTRINVGAWTHIAVIFEYSGSGTNMRNHFYINGKQRKVSGMVYCDKDQADGCNQWGNIEAMAQLSKSTIKAFDTYDPPYAPHAYALNNNMYIAFGGSAPNISAVKGSVDDFQVWGKAMTAEDVKASMAGLDKNNLPADVLGFWDLESDPDTDNGFIGAVGANATMPTPKAYWYKDNTGEGEGQAFWSFDNPTYLSGCPFMAGESYEIVTEPTWSTRRATVEGTGTGSEGSAKISWVKPGDYTVNLTLTNGHGSDSKDYPVIKIGDLNAIGDVAVDGDDFTTYTIDDCLFVDFAADGAYTIEVYNMAGQLGASKAVDAVAGQNARIALGNAGVYLVKVTKDGQVVRTVKVIRK